MPSETISQPRLLLRRLHGVMASAATAQERLDRVVRVIAQNMVAEVCSIYLKRAGNVLELFATEGLKPEAVHTTRMTEGEGLVGLVAERGLALNLSDAPHHPRFSYRPETGEDVYRSFLGVPVMRQGAALGVLTVQNVAQRRYSPEEVEVLQTIAMVLAETISSGDLVSADELHKDTLSTGTPITLDGVRFSSGMASGIAVFHRPQIAIKRTVAEDVTTEFSRLEAALSGLRKQFETMLAAPELAHGGDHRAVLETFAMYARDQSWERRLKVAIETGLTAEAAAQRVLQDTSNQMSKISDYYIRERLGDVEELTRRLLQILTGEGGASKREINHDFILVARTLGASELLEYDRTYLKGIVLQEGSATAHVTIVARAMGLPLLGRIAGLMREVEQGEPLIIDTQTAHLYVRPTEDIIDVYRAAMQQYAVRAAEYESERLLPAETKDGTVIRLMMNAGLLVDLPHLEGTDADGIGLFRTEFQFMVAPALPKVEEQRAIYAAALETAGFDRPVYFRTLDIGGDKPVPFLPRNPEENPAMGWRAIRISMDRPALLRYQIRALLQAGAGHNLKIMFPMITDVSEMKRCRSLVEKEQKRLVDFSGISPKSVDLGCMIEVPSLVYQLPQLAQYVDFLSIGTNDLMQFFYACDRGNPKLTGRYDILSPPALRFIHQIVVEANQYGIPLSVCGEAGGRPVEMMALIGLGIRRLSVTATAIGPIKRVIRQINLSQIEAFVKEKMASHDISIRDSLKHFAKDHGIEL